MKLPNSYLCVEEDCSEVYSSVECPTLACPACGSRNPFPLSRAVAATNAPGMTAMRHRERHRIEVNGRAA